MPETPEKYGKEEDLKLQINLLNNRIAVLEAKINSLLHHIHFEGKIYMPIENQTQISLRAIKR